MHEELLEGEIGQKVQLAASEKNIWLGRNNSGVLYDATGRPVRYGLGNISKKQNDIFKSSDYIGIMPVVVTQEMVGRVVGIFTACETKVPGFKKDARYEAQKNFITFIRSNGGMADFATSADDFRQMVAEWTTPR